MATPFTGGCACGAVRYECAAEPVMTGNCHCRDCQKATGGAFVPALAVPTAALKITGEASGISPGLIEGPSVGEEATESPVRDSSRLL